MKTQFFSYGLMLLAILTSLTYAQSFGNIERLDARLDKLIPVNASLEKLAEGFEWTEGPLWFPTEKAVLFTDIPKNTIYQWQEKKGLSIFLRPAGYTGDDPPGAELGANGLFLDAEGRLTMCDHGNRSVSRLNMENFTKTVLTSAYKSKRLNSPNDGIFKSNGDLYFTDPPYGLYKLNDDPQKELDFNGVYRLSAAGELTLLTKALTFPNGIAFSPDEKTLYVAVSDPEKAVWMAFDVKADGTLENDRVFYDATDFVKAGKKGLPDGIAIDKSGNLFATGPGGVNIFSADGTLLGRIDTGQATSNCAFGDDGSSLYITADMYLCRIRLAIKGLGF